MGTHAEILNKILKTREKKTLYLEEEAFGDSKSVISSVNSKEIAPLLSLSEKTSYGSNSEPYSARDSRMTSTNLDAIPSSNIVIKEKLEWLNNNYKPLNESVGHTEIQVLVGAFLGFIVSLAIDTIL